MFGSGYLANAGIVPALVGRGDLILIDELAHSSLWTGARLSRADGAAVPPQRHRRMSRTLLAEHRAGTGRALIVTEGVFSMDGDLAPLPSLRRWRDDHDAWLMVDDAHDLDFAGAARADVPLRIGTLSKAIGGYGGYLCASQPVIDLIRNRARTLIYSTGLPPAIVAAAIAALDLIEREPDLAGAAARQGAGLHPRRRTAARRRARSCRW